MKELKVPRESRSSREILLVDLLLLADENFGSFFMKVVKAPKSSKACLRNLDPGSCSKGFLL